MKHIYYIMIAAMMLAMTSCLSDGDKTLILSDTDTLEDNGGTEDETEKIPSDDQALPNPAVDSTTGALPNGNGVIKVNDGYGYITLTGIYNSTTNQWIDLVGTNKPGQNVWLSIDGKPKGFIAYNIYGNQRHIDPVVHDVVFLVNNAVTMTDVLDTLTTDIIDWAQDITAQGIDLRVGCVGYDEGEYDINGAIDVTTVNDVATYLTSAASRPTIGFGGNNSGHLKAKAQTDKYITGHNNECAMVALKYADGNFSFRSGSNRIYINITEEYNQPAYNHDWSVEFLDPDKGLWLANQGTVHTIYCSGLIVDEIPYIEEKPWRMSTYTGGTVATYDSPTLLPSLPGLTVTLAEQHSHLLRFGNARQYMDGEIHDVHVTVRADNGEIQADRHMHMRFTQK